MTITSNTTVYAMNTSIIYQLKSRMWQGIDDLFWSNMASSTCYN